MADQKISALTSASTPLAGTEVLPIVQSGATVKTSIASLTQDRNTIGLLVAPSSLWTIKAAQFGTGGAIFSTAAAASNYTTNLYFDGAYKHLATGAVARFAITSGGYSFQSGVSANANDPATLTTKFAVELGGDVRVNIGNLIPATAAKGVNFTANTPAAGMTSQLLNWYEEGTWTPQYTNSTPPTTPYTMSITSATYTRIGRVVTIVANIATSNVNASGASGTLRISGLPFTSAAHGVVNIGYAANWNTNFPSTGYVESGATTIALQYRATANGATAALNETNLVSGASAGQNQIIFTATYIV